MHLNRRVMIRHSPGGPETVRAGWLRALLTAGHQGAFWVPERKSAFDAFTEFAPDCLLSTTYDLDDAEEKCIRARPHLRVGLFGSAWGPLADALPAAEFPIVRVTDAEKRRLERLKRDTGRPDFVFIHASGPYLEGSMSGWREIGIEPIGVLNAADICLYRPGRVRAEFRCNVSMVGARWPYKARNLDPWILPLCQAETGLSVKLFGRGGWDNTTPCYLGRLGPTDEPDLFASTDICLNISEPHSTDHRYGADIVERPFKVLACGGFLLSDAVPEMLDVFATGVNEEPALVTATSPAQFREIIDYFLHEEPERRASIARAGQALVLSKHTYFHRVAQFFRAWNLPEESLHCLQQLQKFPTV